MTDEPIVPEKIERAYTLEDVRQNICDPLHWIDKDGLVELVRENPSLRGMLYGYAAEAVFIQFLEKLGITEHFKPDDHKKTKSDRTFTHLKNEYTLQLKSLQTNSIREVGPGRFTADVQNDASDRRKIKLPTGDVIETTCYLVGEYDILGVSLQPFTGEWRFAFKKNSQLRRTTSRKYTPDQQQHLLATIEKITWPLSGDWTEDLMMLLKDPELGHAGQQGIEVEIDTDLFRVARDMKINRRPV